MKVKVWEITDGSSKWYLLYDKRDDYQNCIYNNGFEEVDLPDNYELGESESGRPFIYKNGFAYDIHKDEKGYILFPASLTIREAYERKMIRYI